MNLLQTLISWHTDKKIMTMLQSSGLSANSFIHVAYLNILSLVVNIAKSLPKSWIRYPHRYVEEMIETMLELLFIPNNGSYSPMDMIAIIDYEATWLRDWFHGKTARTIFIKNVNQGSFIANLVNGVSKYPNSFQKSLDEMKSFSEKSNFNEMSPSVIEYGSFLHKISFLSRIFSLRQGRTLDFRQYVNSSIRLSLDPLTAETSGSFIASKTKNLFNAEYIPLVLEILNKNLTNENTIKNALEICSLADTSDAHHEALLPVLLNVLNRFPGNYQLLKKTLKVFGNIAKNTKAHVSSDWKSLMDQLPQDKILPLLQYSPSLLLLSKLPQNCHITNISVACKNRKMSEFLLKFQMWDKRENILCGMLGLNDEAGTPCANSRNAAEIEEIMQEIMMSLSSNVFIVELTRENRILKLIDVENEGNDIEWNIYKLRMILSACSNLDSLVYLENKFQLSERILKSMDKFKIDDEYTVDEQYLYLQYIDNMTKELGGPNEKKRLQVYFSENLADFPEKKTRAMRAKSSKLVDFITDTTRVADLGWLDTAGKLLKDILVANSIYLESSDIKIILAKIAELQKESHMATIMESLPNNPTLGNDLVINYGKRIGCLKTEKEKELEETFKSSRKILGSELGTFDWFVASLFLMTEGDSNLTVNVLKSMDGLLLSPFLWHSHGASKYGDTFQMRTLGIGVELVMEEELPVLYSFFKINKVPVCVILDLWLRQCFLNFLDFKEIEHFILFPLLYGADYIVYFCISVLSHIQVNILDQDNTNINIYQKTLTQQILEFNSGDYLPFMDKLSTKYKSILLQFFTESLHH